MVGAGISWQVIKRYLRLSWVRQVGVGLPVFWNAGLVSYGMEVFSQYVGRDILMRSG